MLEIRGLDAWYGRAQIVSGLSFRVRPGEVVAVLGRNGAGKTTTLKRIVGLVGGRGGEILFCGERIDRLPPYRIARLGLGYVPEDRRIFTDLTVRENLEVGRQGPRPGVPHWTESKLFDLFTSLERLGERRGGRISGGEQQMLAIARTLIGNPRAVLLDEPAEGLAPLVVEQMARTILALKAEGLAVLLCEQNLRFARRVADRALLLEQGRLRGSGTMVEIEKEYARL
ncbi:MAG: ABC transporter ATP-binding protein [Burkholderiales bacterium]